MRREELAHIRRSAARIIADGDILVIGSQAIPGTFDEDQLPVEVWRSVEAPQVSACARRQRRPPFGRCPTVQAPAEPRLPALRSIARAVGC